MIWIPNVIFTKILSQKSWSSRTILMLRVCSKFFKDWRRKLIGTSRFSNNIWAWKPYKCWKQDLWSSNYKYWNSNSNHFRWKKIRFLSSKIIFHLKLFLYVNGGNLKVQCECRKIKNILPLHRGSKITGHHKKAYSQLMCEWNKKYCTQLWLANRLRLYLCNIFVSDIAACA